MEKTNVSLQLPGELHRQLKANAALAGKSLSEYCEEILTQGAERCSEAKKKTS